jgi:DNA adenine methylase
VAFYSPLRYPGGKGDLANFMKLVYIENNLQNNIYVEPYAGGAGVALTLLLNNYTNHIYINDIDRSIYSFWYSVLNETEQLCDLIKATPVNIDVWNDQQAIQTNAQDPKKNISLLQLGFSTFFLNRTNRSGIIKGGVIGGKNQDGPYKLDVRFNRNNLIDRIKRIAKRKSQITIYNIDAAEFILTILPTLPEIGLVYLDPPYYAKGQGLYENFYTPENHQIIAELVSAIPQKWIVSYDDIPQIQVLYEGFRQLTYRLSYSATKQYQGNEVMFFSPHLNIPKVDTPTKINPDLLCPTLFKL